MLRFILYIDVFVLWLFFFKTFSEYFPAKVVDLSQFFAPTQRLKPMITIGSNSLKMLLINSITLSLIVNKRVYLWPSEKGRLSQTTQSGIIILSGFLAYDDSRNVPEWACVGVVNATPIINNVQELFSAC